MQGRKKRRHPDVRFALDQHKSAGICCDEVHACDASICLQEFLAQPPARERSQFLAGGQRQVCSEGALK